MRNFNSVTPGFGSGGESELWTKEKVRLIQFYQIENNIMESEVNMDYAAVMRASRVLLRLLMELMVEDQTNQTDEIKKKLYGIHTQKFIKLKEELDELENRWLDVQKRNSDPSVSSNQNHEMKLLVGEIKAYVDKLFFTNTELGLNYKRKDVYSAWKE